MALLTSFLRHPLPPCVPLLVVHATPGRPDPWRSSPHPSELADASGRTSAAEDAASDASAARRRRSTMSDQRLNVDRSGAPAESALRCSRHQFANDGFARHLFANRFALRRSVLRPSRRQTILHLSLAVVAL